MFSDNIFGGKQKALSAALEYRDALIFAAPSAEHNLWHRTIVRRNNTSGIPGVGLYKRPNGSEKWVACWIDENGIRKSRTFSVNIYGKRKILLGSVAKAPGLPASAWRWRSVRKGQCFIWLRARHSGWAGSSGGIGWAGGRWLRPLRGFSLLR